MSTPELTVVVPTYNRSALLDEALSALAGQDWSDGDWDVVVVDNNSTDDTPAVLARWVAEAPMPLRVVRATDGCGPAYSRNVGVRNSTAPHLAFVDDDDLVGAGWVEAMGTALRAEAFVASRYDYTRLNSAEAAAANDVNVHQLSRIGRTPVASGAGLGCHRNVWDQLGGMNETLRYGEDIDFSLQASKHGVDPVFKPDAVYHFRLRSGTRAAFNRGRHLGKASVNLYLRYGRTLGARPDRFSLLARVWAGYAVRVPALRHGDSRMVYAEQLGRRLGRLQQSLRAWVWYP